jgi:hypothetical protein
MIVGHDRSALRLISRLRLQISDRLAKQITSSWCKTSSAPDSSPCKLMIQCLITHLPQNVLLLLPDMLMPGFTFVRDFGTLNPRRYDCCKSSHACGSSPSFSMVHSLSELF